MSERRISTLSRWTATERLNKTTNSIKSTPFQEQMTSEKTAEATFL